MRRPREARGRLRGVCRRLAHPTSASTTSLKRYRHFKGAAAPHSRNPWNEEGVTVGHGTTGSEWRERSYQRKERFIKEVENRFRQDSHNPATSQTLLAWH